MVVKTPSGNREEITFCVDRKKPTVNIKNNKIYNKEIKVTYKDTVSGIKNATLNGKTIKSGEKITKNGKYILKITDKAGNIAKIKFEIRK